MLKRNGIQHEYAIAGLDVGAIGDKSARAALKIYPDQHFPKAKVTCAYEASKFGFWSHREL